MTVAITAQMVKALRDKTGAGMMDCKKALAESAGDNEQAIVWLREKGLAQAKKRAGRAASEGLLTYAEANDGAVAALVELKCETDFVARADKFQAFAQLFAEQVVKGPGADASQVAYADEAGVPAQATLAEPSLTVQDKLNDLVAVLGENIQLGRLARMVLPAGAKGVIGSYIHSNGKIGVLVELLCEGDCAAEPVAETAKNVAMQIAAANPVCCTPEEVPTELLDKEKAIYKAQALEEGKPEQIAEKIVEGRIKKYFKEVCLLEQPYIKDDKKTVQGLVDELSKQLGQKVRVTRFMRLQLGEDAGEEG